MKLNYRAPTLGLLVALAACGTESESPMSVEQPLFATVSGSSPANVYVCKVDYFSWFGAELPAPEGVLPLLGSGEEFDIDIADQNYTLQAGDWADMAGIDGRRAVRDGLLPDNCAPAYTVTTATMIDVMENLEVDQAVKKITVRRPDTGVRGFPQLTYEDAIATAGTSQGTTVNANVPGNYYVFFKNIGLDVPDEETGTEGCTPGYWGRPQHLDSWPPTGYAPADDAATVFGVDLTGTEADGWTLLDAINQRGNGNSVGQMIRHATAALLNASHPDVDYPMTAAEVIADFQAAYASGDYESQKDVFAEYNELGCGLN